MLEEIEIVRHRSKKDTKRWCKGKVGREHEWTEPYQKYPDSNAWLANVMERKCVKCSKRMWA